jgi:hypothetical protein
MGFYAELKKQRWDDHRLYHHSYVNQALHLLSAISFLFTYAFMFVNPVLAAFMGWIIAMCLRQVGHFFFEPDGYDEVNQLSHERKEEIKVGYNLRRKVVLLSIWALSPIILLTDPNLFGLLAPHANTGEYIYNLAVIWLCLGFLAVLFRAAHLFFIADVRTGLAWATKILTDPFHDIKMYYKAPYHLLRGELIDPMVHVR